MSLSLPTRAASVAALLLATALSGCAVGPDFATPKADPAAGYLPSASAVAGATAPVGGARLVYGADIPGRWWELFRNRPLNDLIKVAIANNPDLEAARAALRKASEAAASDQASLFPTVSASGTATRADNTGALATNVGPYTLYTGQIGASWDVDLWGGKRRTAEASRAAAEAQAFTAEATYLTLTTDLTNAVITEASTRAQIAATEDIIKALEELLGVLDTKANVGSASRASVLQQRATLAQARATLPGLKKTLAQTRNRIAAYAGEFPSSYRGGAFTLGSLTLPHKLPLTLPADLIRQRPDIRAAEAQLHQASALVGVAIAARLPSLSLSAALPTSTTDIAKLLNSSATGWSLAASASQTLFDAGKLQHQQKQYEAALDQALANYRSVVIAAYRDVANALRAIQHDAEAVAAYRAAEEAARESLELARTQFKAGTGSYTDVLNAQQTYQNARISSVQAQAQRYTDAVTLFSVLGGGWWNRPDNLARLANVTAPEGGAASAPATP